MKIYRTPDGLVAYQNEHFRRLERVSLDELFSDSDAVSFWRHLADSGPVVDAPAAVLAPIESQEVWAAGVTYYRSMAARMEEAKEAHGGDFYDRVYLADRPEIFFKATPQRVVGPGQPVRVRSDSRWTVPEPELALALNAQGDIIGYTIGNDMSARDIEGENPLYLPQAKSYRESCALGPCLLLTDDPIDPSTTIRLEIHRNGETVFSGDTRLSEMKRDLRDLAAWLFRDNLLDAGCYLLTGTGIVPPDDFSLEAGDRVRIGIDAIGVLENPVVRG
ncbi:MAG TPA: fumarylacetoacetate hydrolase family protein [Rhodothermales bacterium]